MKQQILEIKENNNIAENIFKLVLEGDIEEHLPGQFVNIMIPGKYLRRPISVCDYEKEGRLTFCYKIAGEGTKILSTLKAGESLDVLTGLGNGYDLAVSGQNPLLIGGGMGCAPLFLLAKKLKEEGICAQVVMGFNSKKEIYYKEDFEALCSVRVATADGSAGIKGFATDVLPEDYSYIYTCGPLPMMKAVNRAAKTCAQFSLEERMGCGFGACMGCSLKTKNGYKRICKEGPVFKREEIIWED